MAIYEKNPKSVSQNPNPTKIRLNYLHLTHVPQQWQPFDCYSGPAPFLPDTPAT